MRFLRQDILRLTLAIFVVGIHTGLANSLVQAPLDWWVCSGLFGIAVPTFFLLQGFYLPEAFHRQTPNRRQSLNRWFLRLAGMYALWSLPVLYLHRQEGFLSLLFDFFFQGIGVLWYLLAAGLAAAFLSIVLPKLNLTQLGWYGFGTYFVSWLLALHEPEPILGVHAHVVSPTTAGVLRNVFLHAAPCMALGAWLARLDRQSGGKPAGEIPGWRSGSRPVILILLGAIMLLLELYMFRRTHADSEEMIRPLLLGHSLMAMGLAGWSMAKPAQAAHAYWALVSRVLFLGHIPTMALIWKVKSFGVFSPGQTEIALLTVLLCLIWTALLVPVQRRWAWVV